MLFTRCLVAILLVLPLVGCSSGTSYGVVEGVVTLDGKPLSDVEVVFIPDSEKGTKGRRSVALTDKEGRYRILGDAGNEGAPIGFHRVLINDILLSQFGSAPVAIGPDDVKGGAVGTRGPNFSDTREKKLRFSEAYSDVQKTPFRDIEVKAGSQTIDLKLKR